MPFLAWKLFPIFQLVWETNPASFMRLEDSFRLIHVDFNLSVNAFSVANIQLHALFVLHILHLFADGYLGNRRFLALISVAVTTLVAASAVTNVAQAVSFIFS